MTAPRPVVLRAVRTSGAPGPVDVRVAGGLVRAVVPAGDPDLARPGDDELHVPGAHLLPGMVDGHVHWTQWAQARRRVDVAAAAGQEEAAALLAAARRTGSTGDGLLVGQGFRAALWATAPHKAVLERALPGVPVLVVSDDLHAAWLSPAALASLGREHPTGLLREAEALAVVAELADGADRDVVDGWAREAAAEVAARGVTGILDFEYADTVAVWARRGAGGGFPLRVRAAVWEPWLDRAVAQRLRTGTVVAGTGGTVVTGPFKIMADGSLNSRTAACHHAYPDPADGHGALSAPPRSCTG
ncbi:amidohydrolase family protein [Pseudonocardia sp. HH130630-07]|uniref:amidohydrolase family protein n=1 Tax=Pseudonocardia sp. HH130630-07 TaxID=1690815 RepID=UPI00202AB808|nr:amidohydrolase family protein [Pseudonocardia sp. HH130630-07]